MSERDEADSQLIGATIQDRYEVLRLIGVGGMAAVYEVKDLRTQGLRALKLLRPEFLGQSEEVKRFGREARAAESISDEHVVRITDVDEHEGVPFIVMELLHGEDLKQIIDRVGPLPLERAVDLVMQCCAALGRAHERGVVHRDIKPANIFVQQVDGRDFVKLLDFGISKLDRALRRDMDLDGPSTQSGMWLGSPHYMSPEQVAARDSVDQRTDVYAIGVVLYEALNAEVPFDGQDVFEIFSNIQKARLPSFAQRRGLPREIERIVRKALAKNPDERYQSAQELAKALARFAPPPGETMMMRRPRQRGRGLWLLGSSVALAALAGLWWFALSQSAGPRTAEGPPSAAAAQQGWQELPARTVPPPAAVLVDAGPPAESEAAVAPVRPLVPPTELESERGGVALRYLPAGTFTMGSPPEEPGRVPEREGQHEVAVEAFYLGKYEVTNAQYARFLEAHPKAPRPAFWERSTYNAPDQPVVGVTWDQAQRFARWAGGRLPTEEEWEYACRAGTSGPQYGRLDDIAVYNRTKVGPDVVGSKDMNPFGLFDMLGNALELTSDRDYSRGGSWGATALYVRAAARNRRGKREGNKYTGFRIAADAP